MRVFGVGALYGASRIVVPREDEKKYLMRKIEGRRAGENRRCPEAGTTNSIPIYHGGSYLFWHLLAVVNLRWIPIVLALRGAPLALCIIELLHAAGTIRLLNLAAGRTKPQ